VHADIKNKHKRKTQMTFIRYVR